jgi:WD40 repeat protein
MNMLKNLIKGKWAMFAGLIGLALIVSVVSLLYVSSFSDRQVSVIYAQDGKLYVSTLSSDVTVLADKVGHLMGQTSNGQILYIAALEHSENHGGGAGIDGSDLVVLDTQTGESRVIAKDMWTAQFSPDGQEIVAADSDNKVRLYSIDGTEKAQIGNNGSNPIFTHDGKYVAYHKLADEGEDFHRLFENAKGIALYDITSGKERMLTDHSGDYRPIGFSADLKYFYFNAGRPYESSVLGIINIESGLYSLNMDTGIVTRLTNVDERKALDDGQTMSFIAHDALWTSDRLTAISGIGHHGTYEFVFDGMGGLKSVERVSDGDAPRWVKQDKSFAVRTVADGKESWNVIDIK